MYYIFNRMSDLKSSPFAQGVFDVLKPQPLIELDEWCDSYRILPRSGSSESGKWRTSRTPYLREIMKCLSPQSRYKEIAVLKGHQLGFTEMGLGWIMYTIDLMPGPFLALQPTEANAIRWVKQRVNPSKVLYTSTPVLKETSHIWKLYQESDQRVYELPCPHCGGIEGQTNGGYFELNGTRSRRYLKRRAMTRKSGKLLKICTTACLMKTAAKALPPNI